MSEDAFGTSFLDVAANMLAILIIVTMLALLAAKSEPIVLLDPRFTKEPRLKLWTQRPLPERPFLDYYLAFRGRIVRWEQERYVAELISNGLLGTIALPGGKLEVGPAMEMRDVDSFSAVFSPDFDVLDSRAADLSPETVDAIVAGIVERLDIYGHAPTFVVYPSGMEAFEVLYRQLRERPIWMRWFLWSEDNPIRIERRAADFTDFRYDY